MHFFKKKEKENQNFVIKLYSIHCKYSFFYTQFHSPVHRDKNIQINIHLSYTELSYRILTTMDEYNQCLKKSGGNHRTLAVKSNLSYTY